MTDKKSIPHSSPGLRNPASGIRSLYMRLGPFRALYVLAFVELAVFFVWSMHTGIGAHGHPDINSYKDAYPVLLSGILDNKRTPFYPLLIGWLQATTGDIVSKMIIYALQSILFLFSIKWTGKVLRHITRSRRIAYWFTAVYALYPGILSYCVSLTTESLALSFIAATLYCACEAYYRNCPRKAAMTGILCIVMVMQRPSLLVMAVALAMFWGALLLLKGRAFRATAVYGLVSVGITFAWVGIYAMAYQHTYHLTAITSIPIHNNYVTLRKAGIFDPDIMEPSPMKAAADSIIRTNGKQTDYFPWAESDYFEIEYGTASFHQVVDAQIRAYRGRMLKFMLRDRFPRMMDDMSISMGYALPPIASDIARFVPNNNTAVTIFLIGLILQLRWDISRRRISYFVWLLYLLFGANYFLVWSGAPNDFPRLLAQNYAVLLAVSAMVSDRLAIIATAGESQSARSADLQE